MSSEEEKSSGSSVVRWLVILVMMACVAVVGFVGYQRYLSRGALAQAPAAAEDPRLVKFLTAGEEKLAAGDIEGAEEQFHKASGVVESHPRALHGLARAEAVRVEQLCLQILSLPEGDALRPVLIDKLREAVQKAKTEFATAAAKPPSDAEAQRLQADVRGMQALVIYTLKAIGDEEGAHAELSKLAADAPRHPLVVALKGERPATPPAAVATTSDTASSSSAAASASATSVAAKPWDGSTSTRGDFEFDHEPTPPVKVKGELELPVTPPADKPPSKSHVDTSDLP